MSALPAPPPRTAPMPLARIMLATLFSSRFPFAAADAGFKAAPHLDRSTPPQAQRSAGTSCPGIETSVLWSSIESHGQIQD